jgi:hypothetical protein
MAERQFHGSRSSSLWTGCSAIRTRTAAKRAFNRPLVPLRQLTLCHLESASISSARRGRWNGPLAGTPAHRDRPDQLDADRVDLQVTRDANGPGQPACREPLSKRRTEAVACIRQHTTEAHAGCHRAINLRQSDLWLGSWRSIFDRYAGALQPCGIARPALG